MNNTRLRSEYTANALIRPVPNDPTWMEPSHCKRPAPRRLSLLALLLEVFK